MPERAKVTSLGAIEDFRAKLIVYRDKAARVLDEVGDAVTRTRLWLESDRPAHWQNQIKQRTRELEQAHNLAVSRWAAFLCHAFRQSHGHRIGEVSVQQFQGLRRVRAILPSRTTQQQVG